jgi:hypothetical protein
MDAKLCLLSETAKVLKVKPHKITYLLSSGVIPEPKTRIANKRLFSAEDIERLAKYLGVSVPDLDDPEPAQAPPEEPKSPLRPPYSVFPTGSAGHEVRDGGGEVVCWTGERSMALLLAGLMEHASGR